MRLYPTILILSQKEGSVNPLRCQNSNKYCNAASQKMHAKDAWNSFKNSGRRTPGRPAKGEKIRRIRQARNVISRIALSESRKKTREEISRVFSLQKICLKRLKGFLSAVDFARPTSKRSDRRCLFSGLLYLRTFLYIGP